MNEENLSKYKEIKTNTIVAIRESKLIAFKKVFDKLDSKEGKKHICKGWKRGGKQKLMT